MKGHMPDTSTPSPGRASDGPAANGSTNSADISAATLLLDQPAELNIDADSGQDHPDTTAERLAAISAAVSVLSGQVRQLADEQPSPPTHAPETALAEEHGKLVRQAEHDQSVNGTTHPQSDQEHSLETRARKMAGRLPVLLEWRGMRSTVLGVVLVGLGVALGAGSAVSVSLLVVGVVMLIVGLMGRRLQGRFAIEFGSDGASIEIQTHMAPPGRTQVAAPLAPWQPAHPLIATAGENASPAQDAIPAATSPDKTS